MTRPSPRCGPAPTPPVVDAAFIDRAVAAANPAALRMALYQATRDPELAAMQVVHSDIRGGGMRALNVAREDRARLRAKAAKQLAAGPVPAPAPPDRAEAQALLAMLGAPVANADALTQAIEELAWRAADRDIRWPASPPAPEIRAAWSVAIVGAGISGLTAALKLKQLGLPFTVYDRQPALGGTWALNTYPEARVDIPNALYQFKFEREHEWDSHFGTGGEIAGYLRAIAERHSLADHLRLGVSVEGGEWDEAAACWRLQLRATDGARSVATHRVVISASGLFATAKRADLPGLDDFAGPVLHSTRWDNTIDLSGRRVALVGTGSTGAQMAGWLAETAARLTIFQRTPNWVMPMQGYRAVPDAEARWLARALPGYWNWQVYLTILIDREIESLQREDPAWQAAGGAISARNDALREYLTDHVRTRFAGRPDLIAANLPAYPPAARRLVVDNGWYDTLLRDDVELVPDRIAHVEPDAIVTADGTHRPIEAIVLATGFQTDRYVWPAHYRGRGGATPEALWATDGARAHLGLTLPGMPNFVMFYGPNGQPRSGGFHDWAERWSRYALALIVETIACDADAFEVTPDAFARSNRALDAATHGLIWGSRGSGSYYRNAHGRSGVNMPWTAAEYYALIARPDPDDYLFTRVAAQ